MFQLQNYNEFKTRIRWHDYFGIMINEFPLVLIRRYDWIDDAKYTLTIQLFGCKIYQRIGEM